MTTIRTTLRTLLTGLTAAAVLSGGIVAAQRPGTGTSARAPEPDRLEPCCAVTAIDARTGVVTARVKATGATFTLDGFTAASLASYSVGAPIDLSCGVPSGSGTTGSVGSAACGSNVPRGADTRPKDCIATSSSGAQTRVVCPQGVPIKTSK